MEEDPQAELVYDCEYEVFRHAKRDRRTPLFHSLDEVVAFCRRVTASEWWGDLNGPDVTVRLGYGDCAYADLDEDAIELPRWAWKRSVVLHELTHLVTKRGQAHGPTFTARLLEAHELFGSKHQADELREEFYWMGVKVA